MHYPEHFPRFAVAIPTLNRWDYLENTLRTYIETFEGISIYVLDNGNQPRNVIAANITYLDPGPNTGVAASWNRLLDNIYSIYDHSLVLNDDVQTGLNAYRVGSLLHDFNPGFARSVKDWSTFLISKPHYKKIGRFDENFRAYYEDNDYEYRMHLQCIKIKRWAEMEPMVYRSNSTKEKLPAVQEWAYASREYYVKKWGGLPRHEKFKTPFDK